MVDIENTTDTAPITGGVLDLRPAKGCVVYELLRLGLSFDHKDETGESWADYMKGVTALFASRDATEVTVSDIDTKDSKTVTLDQLKQVTEIKTWRSAGASE